MQRFTSGKSLYLNVFFSKNGIQMFRIEMIRYYHSCYDDNMQSKFQIFFVVIKRICHVKCMYDIAIY